MKALSRKQLESRKAQAGRFTRKALDDPNWADGIEGESVDDYAEPKRIRLVNPQAYFARNLRADYLRQRARLENSKGVRKMAVKTRRELMERIEELEGENEDLQSRLDEIADLVAPEEDESDDDTGEE